MKNTKFIAGFSVFGFLLSILSGLGAQRAIGKKFVMALVFAVLFGACAYLITFIYTTFLESDSGSGFGEPAAGTAAAGASSGPAHSVDITVQDEDLPSEENENQFFVGSKRQMLNDADLGSIKQENGSAPQANSAASAVAMENQSSGNNSSASASANSVSEGGFVPVSLAENADNFSSIEAKSNSELKTEKKVSEMNAMPVMSDTQTGSPVSGSGSDELDVLPEIEDIAVSPAGGAAVQTVESDSSETDFSQNKNSGGSGASAEDVTQGKDAELMAKAISTLLAKE